MMLGVGAAGDSVSLAHPSVIDTGFGTTADCATLFGWTLNSGCWVRSLPAWQQANQFAANIAATPSPVPPAAIPLGPDGNPNCATPDCSAEIAASIAAAAAQSAQDRQDYFGTLNPVGDNSGLWTMALIGAAVVGGFALMKGRR